MVANNSVQAQIDKYREQGKSKNISDVFFNTFKTETMKATKPTAPTGGVTSQLTQVKTNMNDQGVQKFGNTMKTRDGYGANPTPGPGSGNTFGHGNMQKQKPTRFFSQDSTETHVGAGIDPQVLFQDNFRKSKPVEVACNDEKGMLITSEKKSGIHIKESHEGRFTEYKERTGKTTEEALHSKDPHVRQMANFARNAKKWHH